MSSLPKAYRKSKPPKQPRKAAASLASELTKQYVGGNIIAIPAGFVTLCGGYEAAALLSQLLYWYGKVGQREFYKTDSDLQEELRLSPYQLRRARARLEPLGVTTTRKGLPAQLYYCIDTVTLGEQLLQLGRLPEGLLEEFEPGEPGEES